MMQNLNQKGITQVVLLIIILMGIAAGIYVVKYTTTNLKPKAYTTLGGGVFPVITSSCVEEDKQEIGVSWQNMGAGSYSVDLKAVNDKGDYEGSVGGVNCVDSTVSSFKFMGQFSIKKKYDVFLGLYKEPNCYSPGGDFNFVGGNVNSAICGPLASSLPSQTASPSATPTPPISIGTKPVSNTTCSNGNNKIGVSWSTVAGALSYQPLLYAVNEKGDVTGSVGGIDCYSTDLTNTTAHTFPGYYTISADKKYKIVVNAYGKYNCSREVIETGSVRINDSACVSP